MTAGASSGLGATAADTTALLDDITPARNIDLMTSDGVRLHALVSMPIPTQTTSPAVSLQANASQVVAPQIATSEASFQSTGVANAAASLAPTLVFLPGWGMPASIFKPQFDGLSTRFRMLAYDPRGQGESDIPESGYTAERRADDLRDVLADQPPVIVVAWSLGVLEALHYVHRHGHSRLRGLVLVDNSVGEPPAPKGSDFLKRLRSDRAATVERFVRSMFATPQSESKIAMLVRSALRAPLHSSVALLSYPLPREHWRDIARSFRPPLAYWVTPRFVQQAASLRNARPTTSVEIFEGAGHALFVDEPQRFNTLLSRFALSV